MTPDGFERPAGEERDFVTVLVGGQLFGLPIERVHDVFLAGRITPVPLAGLEIVGLINLRGRVVTAIALRERLGIPLANAPMDMAVGIEHAGESFGLIVDSVGEVLRLPTAHHEPNPIHLNPTWAQVSQGVYRIPEGLLVILDVAAVLGHDHAVLAA